MICISVDMTDSLIVSNRGERQTKWERELYYPTRVSPETEGIAADSQTALADSLACVQINTLPLSLLVKAVTLEGSMYEDPMKHKQKHSLESKMYKHPPGRESLNHCGY